MIFLSDRFVSELRGAALMKYHVYKVQCPGIGVDHVFRRFKVCGQLHQDDPVHVVQDFVWLRASLCDMFPGVFVAPLPPKKILVPPSFYRAMMS